MSRAERVKAALSRTLAHVRNQCDLYPNPYVVGFFNGLAMAEHTVCMRDGKAEQLDVAALTNPEPTAQDHHEYEHLVDKIVQQAKDVCWKEGEDLFQAIIELGRRNVALDQFINEKMKEDEQKGAVAQGQSEDSGASESQVAGSIPASPTNQEGISNE